MTLLMQSQMVYPFRSRKPPKLAMVVVDMQEACRDKLGYASGSVEEGIWRTSRVIQAVRKMGRPVILVTYESTPKVIREISEAAGTDSPHFTKTLQSAFTVAPFLRFLEDSLTDALIVAGWVKGICIRDTMLDAIWAGYEVISSDEILFHRIGFPPMDALMLHERIIHAPFVSYFESAEELLGHLQSRTLCGRSNQELGHYARSRDQ
ncbi:MAG: isochorismatase family protein [Candidatus Micrarchaeota archaeon]